MGKLKSFHPEFSKCNATGKGLFILVFQLKFAEPNMKSKHWLEYGCHCFADIKNDILTPGHGRTIDKIGIDISRPCIKV